MIDIRSTLDKLYGDYYLCSGEKKKEIDRQINAIISKAYDIDKFSLFLAANIHKKFYKTFSKLIKGEEVSDFEVGRSLSSLLNHSLTEMEDNEENYTDLRINEQSKLLYEFLYGLKGQEEVVEFFSKYMSL